MNIGKRAMPIDKFEQKMAKIRNENELKRQKQLLEAERRKYDEPRMETSKAIAIYLFFLLNIIIVYSMAAMWRFSDLSALGLFISDIAAQVLIYAIYCMKAYHGKKQSEQIKFDREREGLTDILKSASECGATVPLTTGDIDSSEFETNINQEEML